MSSRPVCPFCNTGLPGTDPTHYRHFCTEARWDDGSRWPTSLVTIYLTPFEAVFFRGATAAKILEIREAVHGDPCRSLAPREAMDLLHEGRLCNGVVQPKPSPHTWDEVMRSAAAVVQRYEDQQHDATPRGPPTLRVVQEDLDK